MGQRFLKRVQGRGRGGGWGVIKIVGEEYSFISKGNRGGRGDVHIPQREIKVDLKYKSSLMTVYLWYNDQLYRGVTPTGSKKKLLIRQKPKSLS